MIRQQSANRRRSRLDRRNRHAVHVSVIGFRAARVRFRQQVARLIVLHVLGRAGTGFDFLADAEGVVGVGAGGAGDRCRGHTISLAIGHRVGGDGVDIAGRGVGDAGAACDAHFVAVARHRVTRRAVGQAVAVRVIRNAADRAVGAGGVGYAAVGIVGQGLVVGRGDVVRDGCDVVVGIVAVTEILNIA